MYRSRSALVLGATLALLIPRLAAAADPSLAKAAANTQAGVVLAQYDGPGYGGPMGGYDDGPMGGMPPGPGWEGPYGGRPDYRVRRHYRAPTRHASVERVTYHGFRIDLSRGEGSPNLASEIAAIEHQIDIVDSVGLSMADLRLFRSKTIRVAGGSVEKSHYFGGPAVTIGNLSASDNRPILLHEYMHVFSATRIYGRYNSPIRHFYQEAKSEGLYQPGAFLLSSPSEFFAMTASCYLYGTVAREPFNRETIRQRQPDYYAYLERLFGPARGIHLSTDGIHLSTDGIHLSTDGSDVLEPGVVPPGRVPVPAWAG